MIYQGHFRVQSNTCLLFLFFEFISVIPYMGKTDRLYMNVTTEEGWHTLTDGFKLYTKTWKVNAFTLHPLPRRSTLPQLLAPSLKYRKTQETNSPGKIPFAAGPFSPPPLPLVQSLSSFMAFPTTVTPTRPFSTLWPITQSNPLPMTSADGAVPSRNPRSGGSRALPRLFSMTLHQSYGPCCHPLSHCF